MARKMTFDETIALKLYHELRSDPEIAKSLGVLTLVIRSWRQRRKLPVIYQRPKAVVKPKSVTETRLNFREVLTPVQSKNMNQFLHALIWASDKAREAGQSVSVGKCIDAWR